MFLTGKNHKIHGQVAGYPLSSKLHRTKLGTGSSNLKHSSNFKPQTNTLLTHNIPYTTLFLRCFFGEQLW